MISMNLPRNFKCHSSNNGTSYVIYKFNKQSYIINKVTYMKQSSQLLSLHTGNYRKGKCYLYCI